MIDYDEKQDVLYVAIGDKTNSYGDDSQDDILVMRDFDTDEITGFTISSIAKKIGLQPVVHGRWDENGYCTNCGKHAPFWPVSLCYYDSPYCQNCGAKMDEREGAQ